MKTPCSRLLAGSLSLTLVLVSVSPAVPAAAQVVNGAAFEGAASRGVLTARLPRASAPAPHARRPRSERL